ncbi:two-component system, chemotaxis family, response regulator CheB [Fervidobacterium changbaicum]|uniref:protein-glutamate methylesterase n=1 Tax=Fervidobacterium islandicum TaxID=2423 RepID=A0AAI8CNQ1_FERIS|nr:MULTISPECIES: chemotaxis protein CheB [Fervidobacterium]AMW33748.2 chemotaxis protein CheB [Fervidobacterium islandicum]SDH00893.1 two-component system, chemotaxis family, response regulator CheB [Fervidobacterium changbaicum]
MKLKNQKSASNTKKVIIVGSAGSPSVAVDILKIEEKLNIPVVVVIHFTSSAIPTFAQHIHSETGHDVTIVDGLTILEPGIYLPEGGKDLVFVNEETVTVIDEQTSKESVHPSISALFKSLRKVANPDFTIIVLGGLGNDGAEYVKELKAKGVKFVIEKTPKFPYLPDNIARQLGERYERYEIERIRELIKTINIQNSSEKARKIENHTEGGDGN